MRNSSQSSLQTDDRKRLRKLRHQAETGARKVATEVQAPTLEAPKIPHRRFKEDRITIALFVFVASCTVLPMGLLILAG